MLSGHCVRERNDVARVVRSILSTPMNQPRVINKSITERCTCVCAAGMMEGR